jgi:hypothetical protein
LANLTAIHGQLTDKPRIGRPIKPAAAGERAQVGLKVPPKLKERLDEAAQSNGRTQSMEAEARLAWSFDRVDLLPEVLRMAYGTDIAVVLALIGRAMSASKRDDASATHAVRDAAVVITALMFAARGKQVPLADAVQGLLNSKHPAFKGVQALIEGPEGEPIRQILKTTGQTVRFHARRDGSGKLLVRRLHRPEKRRAAT